MFKEKKWNVGDRNESYETVLSISEQLGIKYITARLLFERGYKTADMAKSFINLEPELFHNPFLMKDMDRACERIINAICSGEKITVYGDYDVDGVTSVSILYLYLKDKGGNLGYYIPRRNGEGYGVNKEAIKQISEDGTGLIITVDTGITAVSEVEYAKTLGCDMLITDHHECHEEIPTAAVAVVNPKRPDCTYPFKELAGVGVVFKLISALEYSLRKREGKETNGFLEEVCLKYIDLVAIGTVADVMPLCDENRLIVSIGLSEINRNARAGIGAIIDAADGGRSKKRKKVTSTYIGYTVAPRINAAGRISSAKEAVELFLTDSDVKAKEIAENLCEINRQRQYEENKIIEQIKRTIEADKEIGKQAVIVLDDSKWHQGVIGIVASRITEKYGCPSVLISVDGDIGKGSGRSIKGINLVEALSCCSDILIKYGGHELAAGLSIEKKNISEFKNRLNEYVKQHVSDEGLVTNIEIACELYSDEVDIRQAEELELLEPFGISNPVPSFMMKELEILEVSAIGSNKYTKFILGKDNKRFSAVCFSGSPDELGFVPRDVIDIVFNLSINEFQGNKTTQLMIKEARLSAIMQQENQKEKQDYRNALSGNGITLENIPKRSDFIKVFLHLKRMLGDGKRKVCINSLVHGINETQNKDGEIKYVKLRLSLEVLAESGVINVHSCENSQNGMEMLEISINNLEKKVNLEQSCLYKMLQKTVKTFTPV